MTQLMLGSDKQAMHDTIDREFDAYQGARDISIYEIRDLLLDSEIERDRTAEVYLLKSCGVPPSYFNSVGIITRRKLLIMPSGPTQILWLRFILRIIN